MNKILTVIRKEYLERVRSKSFVIGTVLGPALMSMFIILPVLLAEKGGDDARTVGVIDVSGQYLEPLTAVLAAGVAPDGAAGQGKELGSLVGADRHQRDRSAFRTNLATHPPPGARWTSSGSPACISRTSLW